MDENQIPEMIFEEKSKNMEFWEINTIGIFYSLVRTRFNHQIPENFVIKP